VGGCTEKGLKMVLFRQERQLLKVVLVVVLAVIIVIAYMFLPGTKKEPGDFRGIKWGSNIRELPDMKLMAEEGDLKFFERPNDLTKVGDADVDKVIYGFYKDRFYNVMIYYRSLSNFSRIQEMFSREFGKPFQPNESEKKLFWNGEQVNLLLNFDDVSNTGRITYLFKPIQLEVEVSG
jgi:hypothetical protein